MKILSPAGNFESLKMAVFNGADEVYLGINDFNARNNIDGFSLDNLQQAIDFAHLYNVKVLLAINILFSNTELQLALDTVIESYNKGVDAFIVQDLGLASTIAQNYPQIELHASTQMAIHNLEGVRFLERLGFKRVVLARETPLEEITRIKQNSQIEIEYFAHGALCVCFSGNCYLSSYMHNASGNRGKCKQLCRLPYTLENNNKVFKKGFLLSAKDFNMIDRLDKLKSVGVDVIKIEGRARRPFYVAMATKQYVNALKGKKVDFESLKLAFNRNYTPGYFDGNANIISGYNNHIGIKLGTIERVNYGKKFNEVYICSSRPLYPKSTFKIFNDGKEKRTLTAYDLKQVSKNKYMFTTTQKVVAGDSINLIIDDQLENEVLNKIIKKPIDLKIYAKTNNPIKAIASVNGYEIEVCGEVCQPANNHPITNDEISKNFSKSDIFVANIKTCDLDNVFLPKQKLNEFRRKVFEEVYNSIVSRYYHNLEKQKIDINQSIKKFTDFQIIQDLNQDFVSKNIIYSPEIYDLQTISAFQEKCQSLNKNAFLDLPNFALENDIVLLKEIIQKTNISVIANNYYAFVFDTDIIVGAGLNVFNFVSAQFFNKPIITAESNISTKINFPYMTLRHCPFKSHLDANCKNCPYKQGYYYRMESGKILKIKRKKLSTCTFYLTD